MSLSVFNDYMYVANMSFGNSTNGTRVLVDTQNEWSFIMGSGCASCSNSHKYPTNNNTVFGPFPTLMVRNVTVSGQSVID